MNPTHQSNLYNDGIVAAMGIVLLIGTATGNAYVMLGAAIVALRNCRSRSTRVATQCAVGRVRGSGDRGNCRNCSREALMGEAVYVAAMRRACRIGGTDAALVLSSGYAESRATSDNRAAAKS